MNCESSILNMLSNCTCLIFTINLLFFIWNKTCFFYFYLIGLIICIGLNFVLKIIINEPKISTNLTGYQYLFYTLSGINMNMLGLPSFDMQVLFFTIAYTILIFQYEIQKIYIVFIGIYPFLIVNLIGNLHKHNHETKLDIVSGILIGVLCGYYAYWNANNYIKGNIQLKDDDNAPK